MPTDPLTVKIIMAAAVVAVALVTGLPVLRGRLERSRPVFGLMEALAAGVFVGAGLIHMLGDADGEFASRGLDYPWAFVIAGSMLMLLLWTEQAGHALAARADAGVLMAWLATGMLAVHSFLVGAALGGESEIGASLIIFVAVLAHKWAASFALALALVKSPLSAGARRGAFALFVTLFPAGVAVGAGLQEVEAAAPLAEPIFTSLAAGTFLFFGTLHELERAPLIAETGRLAGFAAAAAGFALMAVVAIWT